MLVPTWYYNLAIITNPIKFGSRTLIKVTESAIYWRA